MDSQEVRQGIENKIEQRSYDESLGVAPLLEADKELIDLTAKRNFFTSRKRWSLFLKTAVGVTIIFSFLLTIAVGRHWLNFESYQTFLWIVAGENFIQVLGLAAIAVHFFFNKGKFF